MKRSLELIANFVNGFAEGWGFAVGEFFRDELDIKYTERKEEKKSVWRWTQGRCFSFKEGHTIYDSPKGYSEWSEALREMKIMCKVVKGVPAGYDETQEFHPGSVTFTLSKPNSEKTTIDRIGQYSLSQEEFVNFLKSGILPAKCTKEAPMV